MSNTYLAVVIFFCIRIHSNNYLQIDSNGVSRAMFVNSRTIRADSLNKLALKLSYPGAKNIDLNRAIELVLSGLHTYSKYRDTPGLVRTFDNLSYIYHLQKKYPQAKWFILQSNSMSRNKGDTLAIINSLLKLATIKEEIKDFDLAKQDLNEALQLAKKQHTIDQQVAVQTALSAFYLIQDDYAASTSALIRVNFIKDSISNLILLRKKNAANITLTKPNALLKGAEIPNDHKMNDDTRNVWIVGFLVVMLTAVGFYVLNIKKRHRKMH